MEMLKYRNLLSHRGPYGILTHRACSSGSAPEWLHLSHLGLSNRVIYTLQNARAQYSPKPTLEEVASWGQSFDKLMKGPAGRNAFRDFLRTEFSEENMLFWLACEELKKETNKSVIEEKARLIYEDYISILSPKEVSLDSRVREVINRNMLETTSHTFDDAQLQIYTLMHRDSYPRFMNSSVYKNLLQTLSEPSSES
ncbi:UNVERIFIED_CONTAM: hypothetical protein FKN15_040102 [Acipenser sinensis]